MLIPSRRITPAPRKPSPDTTWAATRVGLLSPDTVVENTTKPAAPIDTSALVRSPAIRCRHWRSTPMTTPTRSAVARRMAISRGLIGAPRQPAPKYIRAGHRRDANGRPTAYREAGDRARTGARDRAWPSSVE